MSEKQPAATKKRPLPRHAKGEQYWQNHIEQWLKSGLSQSKYCREHGLAIGSFGHWKMRLVGPEEQRRETKAPGPVLIPVHVQKESVPFMLEICVMDAVTLRVQSNHDPYIVKQWIEVLL